MSLKIQTFRAFDGKGREDLGQHEDTCIFTISVKKGNRRLVKRNGKALKKGHFLLSPNTGIIQSSRTYY